MSTTFSAKGLYLQRVRTKLADADENETSEEGLHHLKKCIAKKVRSKYTLNLAELKPDPVKAGGPEDRYRTKSVYTATIRFHN